MDEVDRLVSELQTLRRTLKKNAERIERDIAEHVILTTRVSQITKLSLTAISSFQHELN
jgi:hypothetical protein